MPAGFEKATTYFPFDDPVAEGFAYSADTIEGLAAQIDVPVEELNTNGCNVECHVAKRRRYAVLPCG